MRNMPFQQRNYDVQKRAAYYPALQVQLNRMKGVTDYEESFS